MNVSIRTVSKWGALFAKEGICGLSDKSGRGRKRSISVDAIETIITGAASAPPGRTHWSSRTMAEHTGVSFSTVQRVWRKNQIKPHLVKSFKLSNDPCFEEKFWDVIALYLDPPEKAIVFCCDEKSQCQALERSQPCLPLGIEYIKTKTHDYRRHGTTTLFAALNYIDGTLISRMEQRHTNAEWLRFLKQIEKETPKELQLHLIVDNYRTHSHENVKKWLKNHPRFHMHFTPTSSSWMNMVERFFRDITVDCIRDGSFSSIKELEANIQEYIALRNKQPKPYRWRADGAKILEKIQRARASLNELI